MPETSSRLSTRSGSSGSDRAKDSRRRVKRGGAGRAFHRIVEMIEHFAPRTVQAAAGEVDAADDDRQHVVEVVRDAAGQLADRFHLLDLAQLRFRRLALLGFGLERLVGLPKFLGALARPPLRGLRRVRPRSRPSFLAYANLPHRLHRDDAEEDGAEPDDDPEPAEIIRQLVGLAPRRSASPDPGTQQLRARRERFPKAWQ